MDALTLVTMAEHKPRYPTEFNDMRFGGSPIYECVRCSLQWVMTTTGSFSDSMLDATELAPGHAGVACRGCGVIMEV